MTLLLLIPIALLLNAALLKAAIGFLNAPTGYKTLSPEIVTSESATETTSENPYATKSQILTGSSTHEGNPYAAPSVSAGTGALPTTDPKRSNPVPSPSFAKALGIVLLKSAAFAVLNVLINLLTNAIPNQIQITPYQPWLTLLLLLVLGYVITSFIYSQMLPTSFGKAAFVFLIHLLITATAAVPIVMLACVFGLFVG